MIILLHPRSTKPKNRRFPLAVLSLAAVLEGKEEFKIVDGNADSDPGKTIDLIVNESGCTMLAVSVMPGPQMRAAIPLCRAFRAKYPRVPIVWGGYFPSLYTDAALNAPYVDIVVRGQGEHTFLELVHAMRERRKLAGIEGISFKDDFGLHVHNADRPLESPNDFPRLPYDQLPNVEDYIRPTFLGRRTAVHQASIGCPYRCTFCGVVPIYKGRQRTETPERTASVLKSLQDRFAIDAVQFYDNNFFLNESHTAELAERLIPLRLNWWSEGRIDAVLKYSANTLRLLQRAGSKMIFFSRWYSASQRFAAASWLVRILGIHLIFNTNIAPSPVMARLHMVLLAAVLLVCYASIASGKQLAIEVRQEPRVSQSAPGTAVPEGSRTFDQTPTPGPASDPAIVSTSGPSIVSQPSRSPTSVSVGSASLSVTSSHPSSTGYSKSSTTIHSQPSSTIGMYHDTGAAMLCVI